MESTMEEVADRHRKQVSEVHARHQKDMERQLSLFNQEREKKEEEYKKQITDVEEKWVFHENILIFIWRRWLALYLFVKKALKLIW